MLTLKDIKALTAEPLGEQPNRLRRFIDAAKTTQERIAEATGISQPQISTIENGHYRKLPMETARTLADHFGCTIEDLFPVRESDRVAS